MPPNVLVVPPTPQWGFLIPAPGSTVGSEGLLLVATPLMATGQEKENASDEGPLSRRQCVVAVIIGKPLFLPSGTTKMMTALDELSSARSSHSPQSCQRVSRFRSRASHLLIRQSGGV